MIKKTITMSDIAKELGVSTVTVSKALGDKEGVSQELRIRIKEKAAELGYRFSNSAKNFNEGYTYNVGIIVAKHFISDASAFYWIMYRYIVELLQKHSYYGILEVITENDEADCVVPNSIIDKKIDGIIVLGQFSDKYISVISNVKIPTVYLDFYYNIDEMETVLSDSFFGSYTITSHVISKGHKNIGFVGNINSTTSIQDRYLGYYKALLENNLPIKPEWVVNDRMPETGILYEYELPLNMPTAFVCNCDEAAYHFINYLKQKGYRVPEDVSIVGYDNHIYSTISTPRITTIDVNSRRMSSEAVDIIIKKIHDKSFKKGRTLVTGKLIKRDSVQKLN